METPIKELVTLLWSLKSTEDDDASTLNPRFTRLVSRVEIETDCESGPQE